MGETPGDAGSVEFEQTVQVLGQLRPLAAVAGIAPNSVPFGTPSCGFSPDTPIAPLNHRPPLLHDARAEVDEREGE